MIDSRSIPSAWPSGGGRTAAAQLIGLLALLAPRTTPPSAGATAPGAPDFAAIDQHVETELQATRLADLAPGIARGGWIARLKAVCSPARAQARRADPIVT